MSPAYCRPVRIGNDGFNLKLIKEARGLKMKIILKTGSFVGDKLFHNEK
jgi:hypothetical protein